MRALVIIETPYAGDVDGNRQYLREAMRDSLLNHNEAPFASHELYTRCLDDHIHEERELGIEAGLLWAQHAEKTIVYMDRGISAGMKLGIERAVKAGRAVELRRLFRPETDKEG